MTAVPPPLPPGRVVVLPGRGETFVRDTGGDGPVVLLLHGWLTTADLCWFGVYGPLRAAGHRVIALDHRGHGRGLLHQGPVALEDLADDAAALLDVLGVDQALIVGYSLGGAVAQLLRHRRPTLVAGLVLVATALHWRGPGRRLTLERGGWDGALQRLSAGRWIGNRLVDRAVAAGSPVADLRHWLVAELERGHPATLRLVGRELARFDGRRLAVDPPPTAVILTTGDHLVPRPRQEALADAYRAMVLTLEADHDAPMAATTAFAAQLVAAAQQVRSAQTGSRVDTL